MDRPRPRTATALLLLAALAAGGGTCGGDPAPPHHPEALVLYNRNAGSGAETIARYYAAQRGVPDDHLCPVELPPGSFATPDELLGARRTLVESCICGLIPPAGRPAPCDLSNLDAVRLASPITHLAIVKGVPSRLTGTGWPSDAEEPSFDFYLSYLIYRDEDIFAPGTQGLATTTYLTPAMITQASDWMLLSAPALDTAVHKDVAYGRIEAIDEERTLALIDRTVDAERRGITGNVFEEKKGKGFRFLQELTGSLDPICTDYTTHQPFLPGTPESTWTPDACRAATTWTTAQGPDPASTADDPIRSVVPGRWMSTVPEAIAAGLLLGSAPNANGQDGFDGFATLTRWRKSDAICTPLCRDLATQAERDACAARSTDYFHELDTDCVGVARGFLGHQVRSYPVQYYGFFPANWTARTPGSTEKTPPEIRRGGAWSGASFADDRYLHLGVHAVDDPDTSECELGDGTRAPCRERIALQMEHREDLATPLPVDGTLGFVLRLRERNAASPSGALRMLLTFEGNGGTVAKEVTIPLSAEHLDWETWTTLVTVDAAELSQVDAVTVAFATRLEDGVEGFLDLDGLELFDLATLSQWIPPEVGSFDPPAQDATHWGDWAANAIDRLGAIAWWGSASHHLTGGWAFSEDSRFYGAFFMGRTLGESLLLTTGGESGLIYGDPLYRPVAVRIHIPGEGGYGTTPGRWVGPADLDALGTVYLEVLHGTDHARTVRWSLSTCPVLDPGLCDADDQWVLQLGGVGAVTRLPIPWTSFIDLGVEQDVLLRLHVWNPGETADALDDYAYLHWAP